MWSPWWAGGDSPEPRGGWDGLQNAEGGEISFVQKRREKRYICKVSGFLSSALKCLLSTKLNEIITFISGNVVFLSPRCVRISCFFSANHLSSES